MTYRTISCTCGAVVSGEDEELYSLVRGHVDRLHPDRHHPAAMSEVGERTSLGSAEPSWTPRDARGSRSASPAA